MAVNRSNPGAPTYRVSFDVGGTFTDFTLLSEQTGQITYHKVASTPQDPSLAIQEGLDNLITTNRIPPEALKHIGHGTTVATNMVIEKRGARTAVITTRGFRDVLEIGRQTRPHLYDYNVIKPQPLASRELRLELDERVLHDGSVFKKLDESQVADLINVLESEKVEAVAICLMHSYRNPAHEQRVRELIETALPNIYVSASSDILPEFREYERMSTTTLNAYIGPRMASYMSNLVTALHNKGITAQPATVHSNGGLMSVHSVMQTPVRTCLSGPAAGVIGAAELGRVVNLPNLVTFDVGGTSTDVSLVANHLPLFTSHRNVADYPVKTQMVDIHVIGAGGGSIARVDDAGALTVGPESAGAMPGPVAYKRGGTLATLTDAHVVLGRLNPVALLGGKMAIDAEGARKAIQEQIATPLGISVEQAAYGMLRIAISNMTRAVRAVSTERGHDLRDFALCAYGGAGGLHAAELAKDSGVGKILIPPEPGTMCAHGILLSDISMDFVQTLMLLGGQHSWSDVENALDDLAQKAHAWLDDEKVQPEHHSLNAFIEARYQGQNYEIVIPLEGRQLMSFEAFTERFRSAHIAEYGYDVDGRAIEIVNCRVHAMGHIVRAPLPEIKGGVSFEKAMIGHRQVYFDETQWVETPVYQRAELPVGPGFHGPAIIEEMSSTTVLLPNQHAHVDRHGNLIVQLQP